MVAQGDAFVFRTENAALLPLLLVAGVSASGDPAADLDQLARWSRKIPVWVIASRSVIDEKSLQGRGFESVLFRPVDLGNIGPDARMLHANETGQAVGIRINRGANIAFMADLKMESLDDGEDVSLARLDFQAGRAVGALRG